MEGLHRCLVLSGITIKLKKSENPWARPQEMERKLTKEEKKTAELYRLVRAILNKLTPQKFRTLVVQMMQLDIDTPQRLEGVVDRIVEKAISESMYSLAYANMCRCLFLIKVSGPDEEDVTFRKLLLGRCQKEFEKEREDENAFLEKQLSQLEELSEKEKKIKKKEMGEEAAKNKRRMFGNFKFLGELFNLKLLTENIMHDCVFKLLRDGDEESLQCMCALLFKIGKKLDSDRAKPRIDQYFEQINIITSRKKISPGVCLMLRYLVDLRKDDWIPRGRKEDFEPKTINQIHKEAQMERSQERRDINTGKQTRKQRGGGLRDSPKLMASLGDNWTNLTILPSEFDELTKLLSGETVTNDVELKKSENPCMRPQERESELTKEEKKTAELYRVVVAILNKLTPQKFKTLVETIMNLPINTPERLEGVVDRIFEKAISEPMYSVVHANMCLCLFPIKVSSPDEKDVTFRKLLLNRCQKEFEREKEDEKAFLEKQSQLEGLSEEEKKIKKEELEEEVAKKLRRQLGNIKLMGELFKLKLLTENIMHDCVFKLLRAGDEESLQYMCTLLYNIGKDLDSEKAKPRIEQYFEQINKNISGKKVSARLLCMLRDLVDLRKNNWIPRRKLKEDFNPKTIDQIHKEAQMERSQKQRNAKLSQNTGKQRGGSSQDSPKPMATLGDGWMVSGRSGKPVAIDPNKLKSMAGKKSDPDEKISFGSSGRSLGGFAQWGRGTTGGVTSSSLSQEQQCQENRPSSAGGTSGKRPTKSDSEKAREAARAMNKPLIIAKSEISQITSNVQVETTKSTKEDMIQEKQSLSKEEFIRKTKAIVDEFLNIEDLEEACRCFTDLHTPQLHHVFVATAIELAYEMDAKARKVTGRLINTLLPNLLRKEQFRMGLNNVLENAEDKAIDYPKLWRYLAEILTPVIMRGNFSLSDLKPLIIMHVVQCNKAAVFLAEILVLVAKEHDENKAILLWTDSNISWSEVLPNDVTVDEFLLQNNLTFLPSGVDELTKLFSGEIVFNDTVFVFIEKHFKEDKRKEPAFISHLASVVAESCIIEKDRMDGPDCSTEKLKARKNILHKYLDNNHDLEVEVLFALQALFIRHNKPSRMLSSFFNTLYDEEVITEDSFLAWKSDENPARQEGKGPALQSTASFFEWIQSAVVEGNEY